ncbi:hypothetical protein PLICRDRAFT_304796 [Plicaturopsis crispa FD-325 SS-3]|nr:hypothetical protein PLICRDRAFT_304796 [Plicaturopsis crispa FD-325 SS-3]
MRFQLPNQDGVQVHDGFQKTFERTADAVLAGVTSALKSKNVSKIDIAGHSLGAALATMDALMFKQHLPDVQMSITLFGLPRGGNQEFADLVNANLGSTGFTFITNQHDPVPEVPPRFLGYVHPQGEVHILDDDAQGNAKTIVACPGQENEHCSEGNSLLDASVQNHLGPYFQGIKMSAPDCPLGAN